MENLKNDLKNSIEKLEKLWKYLIDQTAHCTRWGYNSIGMNTMKRDMIGWELARQKRELEIVEWLEKMSEPVCITINEPSDIDWDKVRTGPIKVSKDIRALAEGEWKYL